jgi:hypothetical protein
MKLGVTLDILNQKDTPAFYADTLANRPAAGFTGRVFISTDTLDLYRDTGTTWVLLSPSSTGTITGSGAAGQVTFFSSASSITGTNDLFYDSGNNRLGINTNAPTAPLDVHSSLSGALLQLNQTSGTSDSQIGFQSANVGKWRIGSYYNAGQYSFGIYDVFNSRERFSVLNTGQTFVGDQVSSSGKLVVNSGSLGDTGLVVISSSSPSIRINNGGTGANFRCGLGISTAANNFIQGSVDGDFCIFNSNTGTYPILFGINDTGLGNTQEAARVSAARNFLIGTTTDAGQKLQVNGTANITGTLTGAAATLSGLFTITSGSGTQAILNTTRNFGVNRNFQIAVDYFNEGEFSITPSTTLGGSVYTTPVLKLSAAGPSSFSSNLGIGVSPSSWGSGYTGLDVGRKGSGFFSVNASSLQVSCNYYYDGSNYLYANNGPASNFGLFNGGFGWSIAGSGTAGSPITFTTAMNIAPSTGNLLLNTSVDAGQKLQVNGGQSLNGGLIFLDFLAPSSNYWDAYHYSDNTFRINYNGVGNDELILYNTGNLELRGAIKTSNPSGGTAQNWKLGGFTAGAAVQGGKVRVEINGVAYDLLTT